MPAVLVAVDLAALCAILLLIGMLIAVAYTFEVVADQLDISLFGTHPFRSLSNGIRDYIVGGCNKGIKALGTVAHDLWAGAKWSVTELIQAVMAIPNGVHAALQYLWKTAIPDYVKASIGTLHTQLNTLSATVAGLAKSVGSEVSRLDAKIENTATATLKTAVGDISGAMRGIEFEVASDLAALRTDISTEIGKAVHGAEGVGAAAVAKLQAAEDAAIGAVSRAEAATAGELREFIGEVPLTDIEGVIAAVPLIAAAVNILEAETGLGRAECRAKVKGICGTDPSAWGRLLEDIALVGVGLSLTDIAGLMQEAAKVAAPVLHELVDAGR